MTTAFVCLLAVILDLWLGEPRRGHPLALFARLADRVEWRLNDAAAGRLHGAAALALLVLPPALAAAVLARFDRLGLLVEVLVVYLAIGYGSLSQHVERIVEALADGNVARAAERCAWINTRTFPQDGPAVSAAAVEGILENGNDAVYAPLFWFALMGAAGPVLYRLVDQLDRLWGRESGRFRHFGWATARLDDLLNWAPARLTALTYAVLGDGSRAFDCWRGQGGALPGPKAGVVVAAGAGALGIQLGGEGRPLLGSGAPARPGDIDRALRMVYRGIGLWLTVILILGVLF